MRDEGKAEITKGNLGTSTSEERKLWARGDEMEAQRVRAPKPGKSALQKALRPKPYDWVHGWHCLPPENPAGHRKANCRIAQMHHSHIAPPIGSACLTLQGRNITTYRHNSNRASVRQGTTVPWKWHGSNRMEVRELTMGDQWVATGSSALRPAGGTTTVERLPSAVSFWKSARARRCRSSHRPISSPVSRFSFSN